MEGRLGHDFAGIRIHTDGEGAATAERFGARALTWGREIWFGAGEYRPGTPDGRRVLAHELVHTAQQRQLGPRLQRLPRSGLDDDELERLAQRRSQEAAGGSSSTDREGAAGLSAPVPSSSPSGTAAESGSRLARPPPFGLPSSTAGTGAGAGAPAGGGPAPARPPAPPRGTNPADCLEPLCQRATRSPTPTTEAQARRRSQDFQSGALACLRSGAAASNASHHAEIRAAAETELQGSVRELEADLPNQARRRGGLAYWTENLGGLCTRQRREIGLEFRYNVVFEQSPALPWGYGGTEWNILEGALSALPDEATWTNPLLIRFRRQECHPDDVDPATGSCGGGPGSRVTAGEADPTTGRITLFNPGVGQSPFPRSRGLGVSSTEQTLRHEVGHVVMEAIPRAERDRFFRDLLGWIDYSWSWITARDAPYETWRAERESLRTELGLDEDELDAWLATLQEGVPVQRAGYTYTRGPHHLARIRNGSLPAGREFEYARSSRGEYFAELYALALSAPGFLHDALPAEQIEWLKRAVFHTPATREELARQAALNEPLLSRFLAAASRLFTWPQIEAVLTRLAAGEAAGGEAG